jgi:hypothetical protein
LAGRHIAAMDMDAEIERRAAQGHVDSQLALGLSLEARGQYDSARSWLAKAAQSGNPEALTALGINLLVRPPLSHFDGVKAIIAAANAGGAHAIHIAGAMAALGAGLPQNWPMAFDCLHQSAERGWRQAQVELRLLSNVQSGGWKGLRDGVDVDALLKSAPMRVVHEHPRVSIAEKFLTSQMCDWLIERAKPKIGRAHVFDAAGGGGKIDRTRNNSATDFNIVETDLILALIRARIATATGLAPQGMEHSQVLHYSVGQQFAPHFDFLDPAMPAYAQNIASAGQRVATFLIYLNDEFDAAETSFLALDWRYRGGKGDAILFWNVDEQGVPDRQTLHAGLAPTRGEKWLFSQWIRGPRS